MCVMIYVYYICSQVLASRCNTCVYTVQCTWLQYKCLLLYVKNTEHVHMITLHYVARAWCLDAFSLTHHRRARSAHACASLHWWWSRCWWWWWWCWKLKLWAWLFPQYALQSVNISLKILPHSKLSLSKHLKGKFGAVCPLVCLSVFWPSSHTLFGTDVSKKFLLLKFINILMGLYSIQHWAVFRETIIFSITIFTISMLPSPSLFPTTFPSY